MGRDDEGRNNEGRDVMRELGSSLSELFTKQGASGLISGQTARALQAGPRT